MGKRYKVLLLLVLLVALSTRTAWVLNFHEALWGDSLRYHELASGLLAGKGYPTSFTSPAYPFFLAGICWLFGSAATGVRIAQALISTASVFLVYLLAGRTFKESSTVDSRSVGLATAAMASVYPFFVYYCGLVLTETLFVFLFVLLWLLMTSVRGKERPWLFAVLGAVWGVNILIKPVMLHFLAFCILAELIMRKLNLRRAFCWLLACAVCLAVLSPWALHNYRRLGRVMLTTTGGGVILYESNNPNATGGPGYERIPDFQAASGMSETEKDAFFRQKTIEFLRNNPRSFITLMFKKQARMWNVFPNAENFSSPGYMIVSALGYVPVMLLAFAGVAASIRRRDFQLILILPVIFFVLLHCVILGSLRYRLPLMPFIMCYSGYGLVYILGVRDHPEYNSGTGSRARP